MQKWPLIFSATLISLIALLSVNEVLLTKANHLKTIVSDADLWAIEREKVKDLFDKDILLLGASRMQVDIDLEVMKDQFPESKIIQLALSGRGCSLPVFRDIVKNTSFDGVIIIDETQGSLVNTNSDQQLIVEHYYSKYSLDRKINKRLSMSLQKWFLFLNPNSNSERLWGNLIGKQQLPPPMFTMTYPSREQTSFFNITDTQWIYDFRINSVRDHVKKNPYDKAVWLSKINDWKPWIKQFKDRGGKLIFVHMPFSEERWLLENAWMPKQKYWDQAMNDLSVKSIHFADFKQLQEYEIPDTSHLSHDSKKPFTIEISNLIQNLI